jgi:hypothetical protein
MIHDDGGPSSYKLTTAVAALRPSITHKKQHGCIITHLLLLLLLLLPGVPPRNSKNKKNIHKAASSLAASQHS